MPVERGNVDHDAARFDRPVEKGNRRRIEQHDDSAEEMDCMGSSQKIDKGTTGTRSKTESMSGQCSPGHPLADEKAKTENYRKTEPGEVALVTQRNAGNGADGKQGGLPGDLPPG